jgi:hypothetical protein
LSKQLSALLAKNANIYMFLLCQPNFNLKYGSISEAPLLFSTETEEQTGIRPMLVLNCALFVTFDIITAAIMKSSTLWCVML